ncbi:MAG: hypothetical protein ACKO04_06745 [Actinomycetes bacterium]
MDLTPTAAVRQGVLTALVLALPAALLNVLVVDQQGTSSPWKFALWFVILFGGAAGGFAVLRLSQTAGFVHAASAAFWAYVVVQGVGVVRRLFAGEPISWLAFPFLAMLMATCGMLGGAVARRWERTGTTGRED